MKSDFEDAGMEIRVKPLKDTATEHRGRINLAHDPLLKRRLEDNKAGQKALLETRFLLNQTRYKPDSDEGKIYAKLVAGDTSDRTFLISEQPEQIESLIFSTPPRHWFNGYTQSLPDTVHTAIALARGGENPLGHPHLRQFPLAQAQIVVPSGEYLAAHCEMWGVEAGAKSGFSHDHSNVRIDGQALPKITWNAAATRATLQWPDQNDTLDFSASTRVTVLRDGTEILSSR